MPKMLIDDGLELDVALIVANVSTGSLGSGQSGGATVSVDGVTIVSTNGVISAPGVTSNASAITAVQTDVSSLKASRTADEASITAIQSDVSSLKTSRTTDEANISSLQSDVSSLKASRTTDEAAITAIQSDSRWTNARTPTAHEDSHVNGSDQIPLASSVSKGLCPPVDGTTIQVQGGKLVSVASGGSSSKTVWTFTAAIHGNPPATNGATFNVRGGVGTFSFPYAGADSSLVFVHKFPQGVSASSGLIIESEWRTKTATSGTIYVSVAIANLSVQSIDSFTYGTAVTASATVNATAGAATLATITVPFANLQSLASGNPYALVVSRLASNTTNDTVSESVDLNTVEIRLP